MTRGTLIHRHSWVSGSLVLLAGLGLLAGCTGALEEKLDHQERERHELTRQIRDLEEQRAALEGELSRSRDDRSERQLSAQVAQLNTRPSEAREMRRGEPPPLQQLAQELQPLHEALTTAQDRAKRVDEAMNLAATLRDHLAQAESTVARQTAELQQAQSQLVGLGEANARLDETRQDMEQRLHAVGAELRRTQEQLIASDAAKSASMQQAGTLMLQLQQLQTQLASMTHLKEEADTRIAKLSEDLAAAQHELGQTGQARDAAHKEVKTLTGRFEAAQKELHLVSRARSDLEARASQLRQQLSTTTDNVLDLTEQVRRLQDQLRDGALHQLAVLPTTLRGGISFSHRRTTLTEEAKRLLGQAEAILHQYPTVRLVIEGYTDSQGGKGFNQLLSQHRANAVRDYLIQQGIAHERLVAIGRGEEQPVASNDTPQGRSLNRRIEFRVTRTDGMQEGVGGPPEGEGSSAPVQLELRQPPRGRPVP